MKKFISMMTALTLTSGIIFMDKNTYAENINVDNFGFQYTYEIRENQKNEYNFQLHAKDAVILFSEANIKIIEEKEYYVVPFNRSEKGFSDDKDDVFYISKSSIKEIDRDIKEKTADFSVPGHYSGELYFYEPIKEANNPTPDASIDIEISEEVLFDLSIIDTQVSYGAHEQITVEKIIEDAGIQTLGQLTLEDIKEPLIDYDDFMFAQDTLVEGFYEIDIPSRKWKEAFEEKYPYVQNVVSESILVEVKARENDSIINNAKEELGLEEDDTSELNNEQNSVNLRYRSHVQNIGWQNYVLNGGMTGTVGDGLRLEAFELNIENYTGISVTYAVKVMDESWSNSLSAGSIAGTVGQSKALEALTAKLEGEKAADFDIYYRTYNRDLGWMDWAKNGEKSGSEGFGYQIEAIEFFLNPVGKSFEGSTDCPFVKLDDQIILKYSLYSKEGGWSPSLTPNGDNDKTPFSTEPIEAVKITVQNPSKIGVRYSVLTSNGWTTPSENGVITEQLNGEPIKGIRMELLGANKDLYELYYRVYSKNLGWMNWASNGFPSGNESYEDEIYDIQMVVGLRGSLDYPDENAFLGKNGENLNFSYYKGSEGWKEKENDATYGKDANGSLRAVRLELGTGLPMGNIHYQAHVQNVGWMEPVQNGQEAGNIGSGYHVEALRISLDGILSHFYDVYYRVKPVGFENYLDWAKNGDSAGSAGFGLALDDVEVKIVKKSESVEVSTKSFLQKGEEPVVVYRSGSTNGFSKLQTEGTISGSVGKSQELINFDIRNLDGTAAPVKFAVHLSSSGWKEGVQGIGIQAEKNDRIEALKINLNDHDLKRYDVFYRVHIQNHGWLEWTKNGVATGSLGQNLRLEAIEVKVVPKGELVYNPTAVRLLGAGPSFEISTHIQNIGWRNETGFHTFFGTEGRGLRLEALKLRLAEYMPSGSVELKGFIQGIGWNSADSKLDYFGTVGQSKRIEEITISLSGDVGLEYDIYYRVHVSNIGWLGWAKNGEKAGTALFRNAIEGLEVKVVHKEECFVVPHGEAYVMNIPSHLKTKFMENNDCFTTNEKIIPRGIVLHSTATPGVMASEWYARWNKSYKNGETNRQVAVHSFLDDREIWQYLPWNHRGWHAGGTANNTHIGIEICEPSGVTYSYGRIVNYNKELHQAYFDKAWNNALTLSVILARLYNFSENDIISHHEGYKLGVASNHSDVDHWFPLHGRSMSMFRSEVKRLLEL